MSVFLQNMTELTSEKQRQKFLVVALFGDRGMLQTIQGVGCPNHRQCYHSNIRACLLP